MLNLQINRIRRGNFVEYSSISKKNPFKTLGYSSICVAYANSLSLVSCMPKTPIAFNSFPGNLFERVLIAPEMVT